ncbi:MAG: hypothetical protein JWN42_2230, partial [Candidatus Angelobacter sp.]|nr:hypothetical protein [Candidatus Angelobacter sp.]
WNGAVGLVTSAAKPESNEYRHAGMNGSTLSGQSPVRP